MKIEILIADDHPIVSFGLRELLSDESHIDVIGIVANGQELMDFLSKKETDVLFLDLNMPGFSYINLLKQLLVYYPGMKVLVFSAYHQPELVREVITMGVHAYLHKTSDKKEILEALKALKKGETFLGKSIRIGGHSKNEDKDSKEIYTNGDEFIKEISLSPRERDVITLVAQGLTSQAIADRLFLSKHTVETHRKKILRKLSFKSTADLIQFAILQGMI